MAKSKKSSASPQWLSGFELGLLAYYQETKPLSYREAKLLFLTLAESQTVSHEHLLRKKQSAVT